MRRTVLTAFAMLAMFAFINVVRAEDAATTLKGTLTCAKCGLHQADKCQSVLQVKDGDATVTYYIADSDAANGTHEKVCKGAVENVTVTGAVSEKDGKKWITPTKIDGLPS